MKWRHSSRGTGINEKSLSKTEISDLQNDDEERFTSTDEEDTEIDVVTDH